MFQFSIYFWNVSISFWIKLLTEWCWPFKNLINSKINFPYRSTNKYEEPNMQHIAHRTYLSCKYHEYANSNNLHFATIFLVSFLVEFCSVVVVSALLFSIAVLKYRNCTKLKMFHDIDVPFIVKRKCYRQKGHIIPLRRIKWKHCMIIMKPMARLSVY